MDTICRTHGNMRNGYRIWAGKREETSGEPETKRIILAEFQVFMATTI
jgi:hypothetical protein